MVLEEKASLVEVDDVGMTAEIEIAVEAPDVMNTVKVDVQLTALTKTNATGKIIRNLVRLQVRRKQALLFVTKEINKQKSWTKDVQLFLKHKYKGKEFFTLEYL